MISQEIISDNSDDYINYKYPVYSVEKSLVSVLKTIRQGARDVEVKKNLSPVPITTSIRTLLNGRKEPRSFFVDFKNPVQFTRAMDIAEAIADALDSGDRYQMTDVFASIVDLTRSRYE